MPVFKGASLELSLGPFMHPLVFDSVDTSQYQGVPGDAITVRPSHNAELAHVLVTVRARRSGLIERGSAVWHPESGTWRFVAKAHFPRGEGLLVDVDGCGGPRPPQRHPVLHRRTPVPHGRMPVRRGTPRRRDPRQAEGAWPQEPRRAAVLHQVPRRRLTGRF
ncbi:MAG: hypothetical protein AB9869_33475 [Verrucomicrobiia bacterium]